MKHFLLISSLVLLLVKTSLFAQCPAGSIILSTQTQVNSFAATNPDCNIIPGDLKIMFSNDITDLSPLSGITAVQGFLDIYGNTSLSSLAGLHNITSVGSLRVMNNGALQNLNSLSILTSVNGNVEITGNNQLPNLQGLSGIQHIPGNLYIQNNPQLTTAVGLSGLVSVVGLVSFTNNKSYDLTHFSLPNLTSIGGNLTISGNFHHYSGDNYGGMAQISMPSLQSIGGIFYLAQNSALQSLNFPVLTSISQGLGLAGKIEINGNHNLANLDGFTSLTYMGGTLDIVQNQALENLDGLGALTGVSAIRISASNVLESIEGLSALTGNLHSLQIVSNPVLENLNGLEGITAISNGNLIIKGNSLLSNLTALSNLTHVQGDLEIADNPVLQSIGSFANLVTVGKNLYIINNSSLLSIAGFSALASVGETIPPFLNGNVMVVNNPSLMNLTGLEGLQNIRGNLSIHYNNLLNNISGLGNVVSVGGILSCNGNSSLITLNGLNIVTIGSGISIVESMLANLDGLSSVTNLSTVSAASITINNNASLLNINGLANHIGWINSLTVFGNTSLQNLDGLAGVTIASSVNIQNNNMLTNVGGLSGLTSITSSLRLFNNALLEDIQGIRNATLQLTTNTLHIYNNPKLFVCDLQNICVYRTAGRPVSIHSNGGDCYTAALSCPTIWNGSSWSNGIPNGSKSAIVAGALNVTAELQAKNLTLNGGSLNITDGGSLNLNGSIVNNLSPEAFTVQHGGGIIQNQTANNIGKITVRRSSAPFKRLDYAMWSSPVVGQNLFSFSPNTINGVTNYQGSTGRIYAYEGSVGYINPTPFTSNAVMQSAKGYLFRAPNDWSETTATAYPGAFVGVPESGAISISTHPESYTSIGNPYPSILNADALLAANPGISTIYYWTTIYDQNGETATANSYASYTSLGGVPAAPGSPTPDEKIAVATGFIVESLSASVSFNNSMRIGNNAAMPADDQTQRHRIWLGLRAANNLALNNIMIGYTATATSGIDHQIDGKLFGYEGSSLYSLIDGGRFSIQGRGLPFDTADEVLLGFTATSSGSYTITLTDYDGLFAAGQMPVYLKDNQANMIHDLTISGYTFFSDAGEFHERFEVVFEDAALEVGDLKPTTVQVFTNGNAIIAETKDSQIQSVELFDLQGRSVRRNGQVNATDYYIPGNQAGAYLIRITLSEGITLTKKILIQ